MNRAWLMRLVTALSLAVLSLQGCVSDGTGSASADPAPLSFETIYHDVVQLPPNAQPWGPTWSPDGRHIAFNNIVDGTYWITNQDGSGAFCLTCGMSDAPKIPDSFSYIFPDNARMLIANELGNNVYVLECAPSLYQCNSHQVFPVDLSADSINPQKVNLGRRTYHLTPDGAHLGYSMVRLDALVMIVADLQKSATGYAVANPKVINPAGPGSATDTAVQGWANAGQLYELKGFADGGASALIVGQQGEGNIDTLKVNLATGAVTRLTSNVEWDEDGAISPNGQNMLNASWRTMHRLEALSTMPLAKPFFDYPLGAELGIYYASSFPGFQCDLQPWLLPGDGDHGAALVGQPVAPYSGGNIIAGNNLSSLAFWSPDSTRILLQERMTTTPDASANAAIQQKGYSPNRLLIARIDREPAPAPATVSSAVGAWAPSPDAYTGVYAQPANVVIPGQKSGSVAVSYSGNLAHGVFSATYSNYSDDGENFLSGTTNLNGSVLATLNYATNLSSTDAKGNPTGSESGSLQFSVVQPAPAAGQPGISKSGSISSTYKGKTAAPVADVGACYGAMPKPSALIVKTTSGVYGVTVNVSANVYGDVRPVRRAVVTIGGVQLKTDNSGNAVFRSPPATPYTLAATAGDTFLPASITVQ